MTLAIKDATGATQNIPFPNGNGQAAMAGSAPVVIASDQVVPVSVAALPLPTGASADGNDGTGIVAPAGGAGIRGWLSGIYGKLSNPLAITGTFWPAIQPVSLTALPSLPAGGNLIGTVLGPLPAAPVTGQQTLTTAAVALPASALQNGLIVTALTANSGTVYIGAAGVAVITGYPLSPGQSMSFAVANASGVSIIGTNATDRVAYSGN